MKLNNYTYFIRDLILKLSLKGISSKKILKTVEQFISEVDDDISIRKLVDNCKSKITDEEFESLLEYWRNLENKNFSFITYYDEEYPCNLKEIDDPPAILYGYGDFSLLKTFCFAIIGARNCSDYGKACAAKFSKVLSAFNVTIVSGLALGIDGFAHKSAIEGNGKTIAVLGNGIDVYYPMYNKNIQNKIMEDGLVITEYPPKSQPLSYHFHQRNRILSGISKGILIVESKKKSGTMITANFAANQGRDVFAIPGNILSPRSEGTNYLIQMGAKLVTSPEDIFEEYDELKFTDSSQLSFDTNDLDDLLSNNGKKIQLYGDKKIVYDILMNGTESVDSLIEKTGLEARKILSILTFMELNGIVERINFDEFSLNRK